PGGYLATVYVGDTVDEKARIALGRQIVELFAGQGVRVEPLLYRGTEWKALAQRGGARWPTLLSPGGRATELRALYLQDRVYPREFRRLLLSSARSYLTFIELILREAPFPLHLAASLTANVMQDALELLFTSRGQRFDDTAASLRSFEETFVAGGDFTADHLALYFQLRGLATQARHFHDIGAAVPDRRFDWEPLAERARAFFTAFERYATTRFSTARERQRRRLLHIGIPAAIVLILTVAITWTVVAFKPLEPVAASRNAGLRQRQGGIKATYFKGNHFQKAVRERTDSTININTTGTPEPKAGPDNFSVRWEGYLRFLRNEQHVICADSDDGMRVWFKGKLLIDDWKRHRLHQRCAKVRVKKGWYPLKVEYHDEKGPAVARIKVGVDKRHKRVIHPNDLCCRPSKPPPKPRLHHALPVKRTAIGTPVHVKPKTTAKKPLPKKPAAK
ncbi:MAG: hypothetical protein KAI47_20540, partial [Deltaproteobacteria bacterium]|nr:hypothetical protein [Deltaproteobacteria bacterium]